MIAAVRVLLVAFLVLTVVRVAIQIRLTGSTGLIGYRGGGRLALVSGALFTGAIALGVLAPGLVTNHRVERIGALDGDLSHIAGTVLAVAGILAIFGAQLAMGASWRIGVDEQERTELVTGGVFSFCRNPIYTAMIVTFLGFALMVPSAASIAAAGLIALALEFHVRIVEEPYLIRSHGEAYRYYAARVGRFVPGVGRLNPRTG